jgi:hypothetical protein
MTTGTSPLAASLARHLPTSPPPSASFGRLVAVETRKFFDTTLGKTLTALVIIGSVTVMTGRATLLGVDLQPTVTISGLAMGTLLPVLGIMSVTSEFSQRTALSTFALEPRRARVMLAKTIPPVIATLATSFIVVVAGLAIVQIVALTQGQPAILTIDPAALLGWLLTNLILVLNGVAIGMLLLNAPAAIVICVAGGIYWGAIALAGDTGATLANWLDLNRTTGPLLSGTMSTTAAGPLAVSIAVWVILPLVLGTIRVVRKEVR